MYDNTTITLVFENRLHDGCSVEHFNVIFIFIFLGIICSSNLSDKPLMRGRQMLLVCSTEWQALCSCLPLRCFLSHTTFPSYTLPLRSLPLLLPNTKRAPSLYNLLLRSTPASPSFFIHFCQLKLGHWRISLGRLQIQDPGPFFILHHPTPRSQSNPSANSCSWDLADSRLPNSSD